MRRLSAKLVAMAGCLTAYQLLDSFSLNTLMSPLKDMLLIVIVYPIISEGMGYALASVNPILALKLKLGEIIDPKFKATKLPLNRMAVVIGCVEAVSNLMYFLGAIQFNTEIVIAFNALIIPLSSIYDFSQKRIRLVNIVLPVAFGIVLSMMSLMTQAFNPMILLLIGRVILSTWIEYMEARVILKLDAIHLNSQRQIGLSVASFVISIGMLIIKITTSGWNINMDLRTAQLNFAPLLLAVGLVCVFSFLAKQLKAAEKRTENVSNVLIATLLQVPLGLVCTLILMMFIPGYTMHNLAFEIVNATFVVILVLERFYYKLCQNEHSQTRPNT